MLALAAHAGAGRRAPRSNAGRRVPLAGLAVAATPLGFHIYRFVIASAARSYAVQIAKFDGSPLGVLLGLHFSGFDNAVLVQQNGRAYQLTLPLPAFTSTWDPTPNLVVTNLDVLVAPLTSSVTPPTTRVP